MFESLIIFLSEPSDQSLSWILFTASCIILMITPIMSQLSSKCEKSSQFTSRLIHLLIASLVVSHILGEAFRTGGSSVTLFATSGFIVAWLITLIGYSMRLSSMPIIPSVIAFTLLSHGLFDGYLFRMASVHSSWPNHSLYTTSGTPLSTTSLALSCLIHRIPESFYLWRLISEKLSRRKAIISHFAFATTTGLGLLLSDELLQSSHFMTLNLSYLQVFISGIILYTALSDCLWTHKTQPMSP